MYAVRGVDYRETNNNCITKRLGVTALLFEVQRKYNKSVAYGWKMYKDPAKAQAIFASAFGIFKDKENYDLNYVTNERIDADVRIPADAIESAQCYLENFSPRLLPR